jgi:hypothetical protein
MSQVRDVQYEQVADAMEEMQPALQRESGCCKISDNHAVDPRTDSVDASSAW